LQGVIRTRVGYAGGTLENPTYRRLGDHTETLQVDYDPEIISYEELLAIFWDSHSPTSPSFSTQYKAVVFYHSPEQAKAATDSLKSLEERLKKKVSTEIQPYTAFYLAEDYHQKYYLQNRKNLALEITSRYPDFQGFIDSTAAARLNGYVSGYGSKESLEAELDSLGLSPSGREQLRGIVR
jgi:peptide-methionine (S)-S-oxide reductase